MRTKFFAWLIALAGVIALVLVFVTAPLPEDDADVLYAGSILSTADGCVLVRPGHADPAQRRLEGTCEGFFRITFDPSGTPDLLTYHATSHVLRRCAAATLQVSPAVGGLPEFVEITRCFADAPELPPQGP